MNIKTISILIVSLLVMMLVAGCEADPPLGGIPTQYVGNYSGKWITTDNDGNQIEPDNKAKHGSWTMSVDIYGFTDLHFYSQDGTISDNPLATVTGLDSGGYIQATGDFFDLFTGEITADGSTVTNGIWMHTDYSNLELSSSGTFSGSKL